jgi:hypothetical protein
MKKLYIILLISGLFFILQDVKSEIPRIISFQCILVTNSGDPLPEGSYELTFRLYSNNVEVWKETHNDVFIAGGMLHIFLGTVNPLNWDFEGPSELGIQIGSGQELAPRLQMTSAAYSFNSQAADSLAGFGINSTPTPGHLLPLNDMAQFPEEVIPEELLTDYIGKNVPDTSSGNPGSSLLYVSNQGNGTGVFAHSENSNAVLAKGSAKDLAVIEGENLNIRSGVRGVSQNHHGVIGFGEQGGKAGVYGNNPNGKGLWGMSTDGNGVYGQSNKGHGVVGKNAPTDNSIAAIHADHNKGVAIKGKSNKSYGVVGWTNDPEKSGVFGHSKFGSGITGRADGKASGDGIMGVSFSSQGGFAGVHARNEGGAGGPAIYCEGDLYVTGAITGVKGKNSGLFIPPAFDSGWLPISIEEGKQIIHSLGGNPDNYFVDMWFKSSVYGIHHYKFGGDYYREREAPLISDREAYGAFWYALTNNSIHVYREEDDPYVEQVRIRIWINK